MKNSAILFKRWLLDNHKTPDDVIQDAAEIVRRFDELDNETRANFIKYYMFTLDHTDKMLNVISISSERAYNIYCAIRRAAGDPGCVCTHCFVDGVEKRYTALTRKLTINTVILCGCDLSADDVPKFDAGKYPLIRFEAFGDLMCTQQAKNYYMIAKYNPGCDCAIWTKNPGIWRNACKQYNLEKLVNLSCVLSSPGINKPALSMWAQFDEFNKLFTVYDTGDGVNINCGARSCYTCRRCYSRNREREQVNELLK